MRVLHVIPSLSPLRGGPTEAVRLMCRALRSEGVTVHVAATDDDGPGARSQAPAAPDCFLFPRQTSVYSVSLPLARWLQRHVKDYDVLHLHSLFSFPTTVASRIARGGDVPYIVRPLGSLAGWGLCHRRPFLKQISLNLIEKPLLRNAAAVHFASWAEVEAAIAAGVRCNPIVIPNPVDLPEPEMAEPATAPNILFLSRFDAIKGLDLLLPSFARVVAHLPEVRLILAGDNGSPARQKLVHAAEALGLAGKVIFPGFVSGAAKARLLRDATVFFQPSWDESFGIAAVEAMARGVPAVVSDRVGLAPEIVASGAGLAAPCDAAQLGDALICILQDPAKRAAMSQSARSFVSSRCSPEVVGRELVRLYSSVSGSHGSAPIPEAHHA